jgi:hypothetical protein
MVNAYKNSFPAERCASSGGSLSLINRAFRNIEFSDYIHRPGIKKQTKGNTTFRKQIQFPKRRVSLGLFFNTRTMDIVRKLNISESSVYQ